MLMTGCGYPRIFYLGLHRPLHRWIGYGRGRTSRHISSAAASLLSSRPSVQPHYYHAALQRTRWQHQQSNHWRDVCCPTFLIRLLASQRESSVSIRRFASRSAKSRRRNFFPASDYDSIEDLVRDSVDVLESGGVLPSAPIWARISRLMSEQQPRQVADHSILEQQVVELVYHTMESLDHMKPKDLSTIILSMAKIAKTIREAKRRRKMNTTHLIFCQILLDEDFKLMGAISDSCAVAANGILPNSNARHKSNLAYAYALIGYDPKLGNQTLLGNIGDASVGLIQEFNGQDISNMVWAYAHLNVLHPVLFRAVGDYIEQLDDLESFKPQALSNILWAYATLGIAHYGLLTKVGDHIYQFGDLGSFKPQELSTIASAYATLDVDHPLLKKVGDRMDKSNDLK